MRKVLLLAAVAVVVTLSSPARAQFCPGVSPWVFDDVLASDPFCGFITWMADNGITLGCQTIDANHRLYCPADNVTRKQMAAFMNRLGNVRVEAVDTGPGLTGGPITSVGTISLAATNLLPTTACANNQIPKWNGSAWTCANEATGTGSVTSVGSGAGLVGGPITTSGTLSIAAEYQLPQGCANGQIPKSNGAGGWTCAADANSGGTVTSVGSGTGLAGGPITASGSLSIANGYQLPQSCTNGQVAKSNGAGGWTCASDANSGGTVTSVTAGNGLTGGTITTSGTIAVDPASTTLTSNFFRQNGNAFGAIAVLGTTDNNAIDIRTNGTRVMRYEPNSISPNIVGGHPNNAVAVASGQTIGGGGGSGNNCPDPPSGTTRSCGNSTLAHYATISGGYANAAGGQNAAIAGGAYNTASAISAVIGGGQSNVASGIQSVIGGGVANAASSQYALVAGGYTNTASAHAAVIGGGTSNVASGIQSVVGGGTTNTASGFNSAVGGGSNNDATGTASTVSGGSYNAATGTGSTVSGGTHNLASGGFSWAGGRDASTQTADPTPVVHQNVFIFSSGAGSPAWFRSEADRTFNVLATGGVRLVTNATTASNEVVPADGVLLGNDGMLAMGLGVSNVYGPKIGIDVPNNRIIGNQASTMYFRTNSAVAWYQGGTHSDSPSDPGSGGSVLATLRTGATATTVTGTFRALAFTATSDREQKADLVRVDGSDILAKVVAMPISTWTYKAERDAGFRHIGPTAQDFHARFGVGYDDKSIATVDADGVALAAIQGLNAKLEARIAEQAAEIAELRRAVALLLARAEVRPASR